MIGSGVFLLPRRFGTETGVLGALIAWAIAGTGMLMLAFVFQRLATRKPDLDAGIFAYAKAGFGDYVGSNSAFGFWASACAGNTSYWVLIMATTSALFPALGAGDTVPAVILASVGVWGFCFLILRGVKEAAIINRIATVAKVVPIVVFIIVAGVIAFKAGVFADNFWGGDGNYSWSSVFEQARGTMLITVFVFLGIEGASVYSRFARQARGRRARDRHRFPQRPERYSCSSRWCPYACAPPAPTCPGLPAVDGGGAGIYCGPLGFGLHPGGCHRLGIGCLPGLVVDAPKSSTSPAKLRRHAAVSGPHLKFAMGRAHLRHWVMAGVLVQLLLDLCLLFTS